MGGFELLRAVRIGAANVVRKSWTQADQDELHPFPAVTNRRQNAIAENRSGAGPLPDVRSASSIYAGH
jgi:hypothetical protein